VNNFKANLRGSSIIAKREFFYHLKSLRLVIIGVVLAIIALLIAKYGSMNIEMFLPTDGESSPTYSAPDTVLNAVAFFFGIISAFMAIFLAYDDISRERTNNSLQYLLLKPVNYWSIVLGKFLGTLSAIAAPVILVTFASVITIAHFSGHSPTLEGTFGFLLCVILSISICILFEQTLSMIFKTSTTALLVGIVILIVFTIVWMGVPFCIASAIGIPSNIFAPSIEFEAFTEKISLFNPFPALGFSSYTLAIGAFTSSEDFVSIPKWLPLVSLILWLLLFFFLAMYSFYKVVQKI
jgi:ABC-type transport system involved in multi-copper enzyme maturation permease subunit